MREKHKRRKDTHRENIVHTDTTQKAQPQPLSYLVQVNLDFTDGLQPAEAGWGDGRSIDFEGTRWEKSQT